MKLMIVLFSLVLTLLFQIQSLASEDQGHGPGSFFPPPKPDLTKQEVPKIPSLTQPAFAARIDTDSTELSWEVAPGAESYHVQIATDPNFKWLVSEQNLLISNSYKISGLEKGKTYFWRVAAVKSSNMNQFTKSRFAISKFETK